MLEMLHQLYLEGWEFADAYLEVYGTNEFEKWYAKEAWIEWEAQEAKPCDL